MAPHQFSKEANYKYCSCWNIPNFLQTVSEVFDLGHHETDAQCQSAHFSGWNRATCQRRCYSQGEKNLTDFFSCHWWNIVRHSPNLPLGMIRGEVSHGVRGQLKAQHPVFTNFLLFLVSGNIFQVNKAMLHRLSSLWKTHFLLKQTWWLSLQLTPSRSLYSQASLWGQGWSYIWRDLPKNGDRALQGRARSLPCWLFLNFILNFFLVDLFITVKRRLKLQWASERGIMRSHSAADPPPAWLCPSNRLIVTVSWIPITAAPSCFLNYPNIIKMNGEDSKW